MGGRARLEEVDCEIAAHDAVGHGCGDAGVDGQAHGQDALHALVEAPPEARHGLPLLPRQLQPLRHLPYHRGNTLQISHCSWPCHSLIVVCRCSSESYSTSATCRTIKTTPLRHHGAGTILQVAVPLLAAALQCYSSMEPLHLLQASNPDFGMLPYL